MSSSLRALRFLWGPGRQLPWFSLGLLLACCVPTLLRSGPDAAVVVLYFLCPGALLLIRFLLFPQQLRLALTLGGRRRDLFAGSLLAAAGCGIGYCLFLGLAMFSLPREVWTGSLLMSALSQGISPYWLVPLGFCLTGDLLGRAISLLGPRLGGWSWLCYLIGVLLFLGLGAISMASQLQGLLLAGAVLCLLLIISIGALRLLLQSFSVR